MNLIKIKEIVKILIVIFTFIILTVSNAQSAKKKDKEKDCVYCKKYEKMKDWPESERPEAFIYEEIKYPEGMFHESLVKSKQKQTKSAPITNNGIDDNAKDFRVEKKKQTKNFRKILDKIRNYFR